MKALQALASRAPRAYLRLTLHCTTEVAMIAFLERVLDAFFAPLARELERLPPQALRFRLFF